MKHLQSFALILFSSLFMATTCHKSTPEAVIYDTLQQAVNVLDAKHALFEAAVVRHEVSTEREIEVRRAYVKANKAVQSAAAISRDGLLAQTPEDVGRLVAAYLDLITKILPPRS